jgi:hypothetical protein
VPVIVINATIGKPQAIGIRDQTLIRQPFTDIPLFAMFPRSSLIVGIVVIGGIVIARSKLDPRQTSIIRQIDRLILIQVGIRILNLFDEIAFIPDLEFQGLILISWTLLVQVLLPVPTILLGGGFAAKGLGTGTTILLLPLQTLVADNLHHSVDLLAHRINISTKLSVILLF